MTYEFLGSIKSNLIRWPCHLLMAGGLCLLVACGGGGGGGASVVLTEPTVTLENASLDLAPFYPGKAIFIKPTFTSGTGKIKWVNASGTNGDISISGSGTLVQDNPLSTTDYTLTVTYPDPAKLNSFLTKTAALRVTITPVTVPPVVLDQSSGLLTTGRSDHAAVRLPDGRVLVSGGTDGTAVLKSSEVFDPSTEKWVSATDMKTARRGHTMTLLLDNKVLVTGGFDGKAALATAEIYDPSSNTWTTTIGPMALTHRFHTATLLPDGNVLIAGGAAGPLITADAKITEIYTPATGLFTPGPALQEARQGHTATMMKDKKVLFIGNSGDNSPAGKILTYSSSSPATSTWSSTTNASNVRYNHTATVLDNTSSKVMVIGGGVAPTTAEIYDIDANSWTTTSPPPMSTARSLHTSTLLLDGRVLVVGGYDGKQSLTSIEIYSPTTNTWATYGKVLNSARAMHTSTRMSNGDVLIVGSYFQTSGTIYKTTEIWRH
jgi:N-acetylneuraminic acid mutarotase